MLSDCGCSRRDRMNSNSVRDTKTAVNTFESRPKTSVVAKPRIGPVPNWNRNAAAIERGDVRVDDRPEHAVEAGADGGARRPCRPPALP